MSNDTLLAVPFFTFMGLILERSGMAEDLLDTIGQLFGPIRGGLAYAVIFVGALLAATTGVVAASVISMGLISLPIMLRYGYDRRLASGVIAASGTLAQIIPPSLVLIVLADQLGRSVGDMYAGAIFPGLVLTALYAVYVLATTLLFPQIGAALRPKRACCAAGACRPRCSRADPAARAQSSWCWEPSSSASRRRPRAAHGRHRRAGAGAQFKPAPELGAAQAGHELDRQADFVRVVSSWCGATVFSLTFRGVPP